MEKAAEKMSVFLNAAAPAVEAGEGCIGTSPLMILALFGLILLVFLCGKQHSPLSHPSLRSDDSSP